MKNFRFFIVVWLMVFSLVTVKAQHTTRSGLRVAPVKSANAPIGADTVATAADSAGVNFSGYEKALRSTKESFFATNNTGQNIDSLSIEIHYMDMKGRQLDSRRVTVAVNLPEGDTRRIDIPSWDRQHVWYYYRSPQPRTDATPYKVSVRLIAALRKR